MTPCVRIAYTADWHVLEVKGGAPVDQTPQLEQLVDRLNAEAPDLIVHGGDLITRYDVDKKPLADEAIREQYQQIDRLLDRLQPPAAFLPGNHDVAFPVCRAEWEQRFGPAPNRDTWDSRRRLGPVELLLMDGFATYDPTTGRLIRNSLTPDQVEWLEEHAATRPSTWRVLALHYDYEGQVLPRLAELGVDCFFYGHSSPHPAEPFESSGCRNGHLPGPGAYRILTASSDRLDLGPTVYLDQAPAARHPANGNESRHA